MMSKMMLSMAASRKSKSNKKKQDSTKTKEKESTSSPSSPTTTMSPAAKLSKTSKTSKSKLLVSRDELLNTPLPFAVPISLSPSYASYSGAAAAAMMMIDDHDDDDHDDDHDEEEKDHDDNKLHSDNNRRQQQRRRRRTTTTTTTEDRGRQHPSTPKQQAQQQQGSPSPPSPSPPPPGPTPIKLRHSSATKLRLINVGSDSGGGGGGSDESSIGQLQLKEVVVVGSESASTKEIDDTQQQQQQEEETSSKRKSVNNSHSHNEIHHAAPRSTPAAVKAILGTDADDDTSPPTNNRKKSQEEDLDLVKPPKRPSSNSMMTNKKAIASAAAAAADDDDDSGGDVQKKAPPSPSKVRSRKSNLAGGMTAGIGIGIGIGFGRGRGGGRGRRHRPKDDHRQNQQNHTTTTSSSIGRPSRSRSRTPSSRNRKRRQQQYHQAQAPESPQQQQQQQRQQKNQDKIMNNRKNVSKPTTSSGYPAAAATTTATRRIVEYDTALAGGKAAAASPARDAPVVIRPRSRSRSRSPRRRSPSPAPARAPTQQHPARSRSRSPRSRSLLDSNKKSDKEHLNAVTSGKTYSAELKTANLVGAGKDDVATTGGRQQPKQQQQRQQREQEQALRSKQAGADAGDAAGAFVDDSSSMAHQSTAAKAVATAGVPITSIFQCLQCGAPPTMSQEDSSDEDDEEDDDVDENVNENRDVDNDRPNENQNTTHHRTPPVYQPRPTVQSNGKSLFDDITNAGTGTDDHHRLLEENVANYDISTTTVRPLVQPAEEPTSTTKNRKGDHGIMARGRKLGIGRFTLRGRRRTHSIAKSMKEDSDSSPPTTATGAAAAEKKPQRPISPFRRRRSRSRNKNALPRSNDARSCSSKGRLRYDLDATSAHAGTTARAEAAAAAERASKLEDRRRNHDQEQLTGVVDERIELVSLQHPKNGDEFIRILTKKTNKDSSTKKSTSENGNRKSNQRDVDDHQNDTDENKDKNVDQAKTNLVAESDDNDKLSHLMSGRNRTLSSGGSVDENVIEPYAMITAVASAVASRGLHVLTGLSAFGSGSFDDDTATYGTASFEDGTATFDDDESATLGENDAPTFDDGDENDKAKLKEAWFKWKNARNKAETNQNCVNPNNQAAYKEDKLKEENEKATSTNGEDESSNPSRQIEKVDLKSKKKSSMFGVLKRMKNARQEEKEGQKTSPTTGKIHELRPQTAIPFSTKQQQPPLFTSGSEQIARQSQKKTSDQRLDPTQTEASSSGSQQRPRPSQAEVSTSGSEQKPRPSKNESTNASGKERHERDQDRLTETGRRKELESKFDENEHGEDNATTAPTSRFAHGFNFFRRTQEKSGTESTTSTSAVKPRKRIVQKGSNPLKKFTAATKSNHAPNKTRNRGGGIPRASSSSDLEDEDFDELVSLQQSEPSSADEGSRESSLGGEEDDLNYLRPRKHREDGDRFGPPYHDDDYIDADDEEHFDDGYDYDDYNNRRELDETAAINRQVLDGIPVTSGQRARNPSFSYSSSTASSKKSYNSMSSESVVSYNRHVEGRNNFDRRYRQNRRGNRQQRRRHRLDQEVEDDYYYDQREESYDDAGYDDGRYNRRRSKMERVDDSFYGRDKRQRRRADHSDDYSDDRDCYENDDDSYSGYDDYDDGADDYSVDSLERRRKPSILQRLSASKMDAYDYEEYQDRKKDKKKSRRKKKKNGRKNHLDDEDVDQTVALLRHQADVLGVDERELLHALTDVAANE